MLKNTNRRVGSAYKPSLHTRTSVWIGLAAFVGWALSRIPSRKRRTYVPGGIQEAELHPTEIKSSAKSKQRKEQGGLLSLVLELLGAVNQPGATLFQVVAFYTHREAPQSA
jgi:hypothetical protein